MCLGDNLRSECQRRGSWRIIFNNVGYCAELSFVSLSLSPALPMTTIFGTGELSPAADWLRFFLCIFFVIGLCMFIATARSELCGG